MKLFNLFFILSAFSVANAALSDWGIHRRGNLSAKLTSYTDKNVPNYGQQTRAELEQTTDISHTITLKNQLRWTTNSLASDIAEKSQLSKKESYELMLGDNYLKYKNDGTIAQIGYQDVVWGEAFGFNYADIINPRDMRETLFVDQDSARLPLLLFNGKQLFSNGSFQVIYSPEPLFSKSLPLDLFIGDKFPQSQLTVIKEKSPDIFMTSEVGAKLAYSFNDLDSALFHYSYLDRDPTYSIFSASTTNITFQENHTRLHSTGLSLTKPLHGHVVRTDIVYTQNKNINFIESNLIKTYQTNAFNFLVSMDSPTFNNFSGVLIFAESSLEKIQPTSIRNKTEQYTIFKITKTFADDKSAEFAYTHEFKTSDNSIQTVLNFPINNTLELRLGGQAYWGENNSIFNKYKKLNSVFFSLKNYFEL